MIDKDKSIDLLFSDLIMPGGMNGVTAGPDCTGASAKTEGPTHHRLREASLERTDAGGSEFELINKPYRQAELVRRIRRVLDGPTGVG